MNSLIQKINNKVQERGSKKTLENLIVLVIILVVTIIFINYIWNGAKKENDDNFNNGESVSVLNSKDIKIESVEVSNNNLEFEIENMLKKLDGVEDASVLITYEETNRIVPMYNEDTQESLTEETDNQGGVRTINENSSKKEVVYEENNGTKKVITSKIVTPQIKGAVVMAKGANNINVKTNIIQAVQAVTGLATHKIQVFEMKGD
jgi:stage III sporulation protein AG